MRQELAPFNRERGTFVIHALAALARAIRRSPKTPGVVAILAGAALCGTVSGAIKAADGRAKRFSSFIVTEVKKDAQLRNIRLLSIGAPGSFDVTSRPPIQRRSTGFLVEAGGVRAAYQVESIQICARLEPACWKVTRVTYGDPS
jgi:hypothetical protein